ncbi:hypothetical protein Rhein_3017 [Rheinheimera sp. A13L]|uniref:hypothetical protein n=1 Tax=Rheinheimera sp. A13L TaxID=506534 RepID=UPI0002125364|nr:hypothetical protein [Rheinheimera sp. A13L]EGM76780.1 hypothetical protein Rhein_3017 [Rheinheimera sp. A13L]
MDDKINDLKNLFLQSISLGHNVNDEILSNIDALLYLFNRSDINILRQKSAKLSYELHELGVASVPYFILLLFNKLEAVSFKPRLKRNSPDSNFDEDLFMDFFKQCFESCSETGIRILTFNLPSNYEIDEISIYCSTRSLLDKFISEPINTNELKADLPPRAICLGVSKVLSHKFNCQHEFYIQFSSILARMNRDGLYQEARDWAEEAVICSYEYQELYYGHYVKFSLYTSQMNVIDSLLNCCLLLTALCEEERVCDELMNKLYVEIFLALRTFNFFEYAKDVYKNYIVNIKLQEYELQKCDLAMLYLRLMENDETVVAGAERYIRINKENIIKFGKSSLLPWFAFICNVKEVFHDSSIGSEIINEFEHEIIQQLPAVEVKSIKDKILRGQLGGKDSLIFGLKNLSRTRNRADLIHEVNQLVVTASRVIESSIESSDIEGVLLGHQLKSDGSVYLKESLMVPDNGVIQQIFNLDSQNSARFDNYIRYVKNSLFDASSKQFLWIGFNHEKLYCVILEGGDFVHCGYIESTSKNEISHWLKSRLSTLAFEDTPNTGSYFITREDFWLEESNSIIESLPCIDIPLSSKEVVLFSDVQFSSFPHNMIKSHGKIMTLERGISSPLSFDNYLSYKKSKFNSKSVYAWAPISEGDMAISIAFSKLKEEMVATNIVYDEGLIPNPSQDINIFISHGGRNGSSGFRGLYPTSGKAYDTDKVFGIGKVAILFVCHAGSIVENVYSNSTHTLVKKLLRNGYEAVISPSWSLNVSIPGVWTKEFLKSMNSGLNISQAVHNANLIVNDCYLSPSASAAMHLFGNDEITCA